MSGRRLQTAAALCGLAAPYALFCILRRVVSLETLVRWAWRPASRPRARLDESALVARVAKLSRLSRADADCLPRSLLLYRELSAHGAAPRLVIGFSPQGSTVLGHAWVEVEGRALGESADLLSTLTPVCTFGAGGRLVEGRR